MIDGAAAFIDVEELTDLSVNRIFLAAHDALIAMGLFEVFLFGFFQRHFKMLGDAFSIAFVNLNHRI